MTSSVSEYLLLSQNTASIRALQAELARAAEHHQALHDALSAANARWQDWQACAERLGASLSHCRDCQICGDGPCCRSCGSDHALAELERLQRMK